LTPGGGAASGGAVNLLRLPNSGSVAASLTETQLSATPIPVSLRSVSGTAVDAERGVGLAYSYDEDKVVFFSVPEKREIASYELTTQHDLAFSGGGGKIVGAVMNPAKQTAILATADGYEVVDYANASAPQKLREIASVAAAGIDGIEINENFGFHPALTVGETGVDLILSGGRYDEYGAAMSNGNSLEFADANDGTIYRPDAATRALFVHDSYVDAISVDVNYHVAVLAAEHSNEKILVNLSSLTLDPASGTYSLPATAVAVIATAGFKFTNLAVESNNHLVMMAEGYGGTSLMVGELQDPAVALGFKALTTAPVAMPYAVDNENSPVLWSGALDPHGAGAYVTGADHPSKPNTSFGLWASGDGAHIAVIDLRRVLAEQLAQGDAYNPTAVAPADIAYFATGQSATTPSSGILPADAAGTLSVTGAAAGGQTRSIPITLGFAFLSSDGNEYSWMSNAIPSAVDLTQNADGTFGEFTLTTIGADGNARTLNADCAAQRCDINIDVSALAAVFTNVPVADAAGTNATVSGKLSFEIIQ
jgi:hypothetical protein